MKIFCLDVDGFLNNHQYLKKMRGTEQYPIDPKCLERFHQIIDITKARVLLHSSWRFDSHAIQHLKDVCKIKLIGIAPWQHPTFGPYESKGLAIQAWLDSNDNLDIDGFAIGDDDNEFTDDQQPFFVQTSMHTGGLCEQETNQIVERLMLDRYTRHPFLTERRERLARCVRV